MAAEPLLPQSSLDRLKHAVADYFSHQRSRFTHADAATDAAEHIWSSLIDLYTVLISGHNLDVEDHAQHRTRLDDQAAQLASLQATVSELRHDREDLLAQLQACQLDVHAAERRIAALETEAAQGRAAPNDRTLERRIAALETEAARSREA